MRLFSVDCFKDLSLVIRQEGYVPRLLDATQELLA
jgi:hypothetical protein